MIRYHDEEWGIPVHDDRTLFEFLILEGAQAGLSWETVLRKRDWYREVFDGFDAAKIARYDAKKVRALLGDPGIIQNRLKVAAAISNAQAFLEVQRGIPVGFDQPTYGNLPEGKRCGASEARRRRERRNPMP